MPIKRVLQANRVQVNKYAMKVPGLQDMVLTSIGSLESELDDNEMPDRTRVTGGRQKAVEFDIGVPAHHKLAILQMESWLTECTEPVTPTHKKTATILFFHEQLFDIPGLKYFLEGMKVMKRATPEGELDNDGEMAIVTYTMTADEVTFLP
jgi:hypothetical protein